MDFDVELNKIEKLNKNWLPWIGEKYSDLPEDKRLIIVGESCYKTDVINVEQEDYIRKLIEKHGMQEGELWNENQFIPQFHKNLEKSLSINSDNIDAKRHFWERVCYFNIIQRPLDSSSNKPQPPDFREGWEVFYKVLDILKPAYCLFNGVAASKYFYPYLSQEYNYYSDDGLLSLPIINSAHPRKAFLKNDKEQLIKIIFIRHTSCFIPTPFSPEPWKEFIDEEFSELSILKY